MVTLDSITLVLSNKLRPENLFNNNECLTPTDNEVQPADDNTKPIHH